MNTKLRSYGFIALFALLLHSLSHAAPTHEGVQSSLPGGSHLEPSTWSLSRGFLVSHNILNEIPEPCRSELGKHPLSSLLVTDSDGVVANLKYKEELQLHYTPHQNKIEPVIIQPPEGYLDYAVLAENIYFDDGLLPVVLFKEDSGVCKTLAGLVDLYREISELQVTLIEGCVSSQNSPKCMEPVDRRRFIGGKKLLYINIYYFLDQSSSQSPGQQIGYYIPGMKAGSPVLITDARIDDRTVPFNYSMPIYGISSQLSDEDNSYIAVNSDSFNRNPRLESTTYNYLLIDNKKPIVLYPVKSLSINNIQRQMISLDASPGNIAYKTGRLWCITWANYPDDPDNYHYTVTPELPLCKHPLSTSSKIEVDLDNFTLEPDGEAIMASTNSLTKKGVRIVFHAEKDKKPNDVMDLYSNMLKSHLPEGTNLKFQSELYRKTNGGAVRSIAFSATDKHGNISAGPQLTITYQSVPDNSDSDELSEVENILLGVLSAGFGTTAIIGISVLIYRACRNRHQSDYTNL